MLACLAGVTLLVQAASAARTPRVTLIGDSVAAGLGFVPQAPRLLGRGLDLRLDARVCRRLVAPSCTYRGDTPPTALQVVQAKAGTMGRTVIVMVGYNDYASGYPQGLDQMMRALRRGGVRQVIWVTLGETRGTYVEINRVIRAAKRRWPELTVADWASHSRGRGWFSGDGLHLTGSGALGLAQLLRPLVLEATKRS